MPAPKKDGVTFRAAASTLALGGEESVVKEFLPQARLWAALAALD